MSEGALLLPINSSCPVPTKVNEKRNPHALLGMAYVAMASLCFSFMFTFIKYMTLTFSSMEATFWRSAGVLVCNFSRSLPSSFTSVFTLSQNFMVLADATSLRFVSPILTFFMGALMLDEKIDLISMISAIVAFGGLVCVVRPSFLFGYYHPTAAADGSWIAICSALLGAVCQALVYLTMRQLKELSVFVIVHYFALASVIWTMLWLMFIQQSFYLPNTFLLWRAIFGTGIVTFSGQLFVTRGIQLEKAGIVAAVRYLDVVFVFIWDSTILGEHINHWSILGALIILICAVIIAVRKVTMTL
ncbi:Permease of the drug/metabolite transporter (DMT) superfamily [Plasmopara halstedii]|uniref:Permease of the drug/metabolite transporter (DMT) superfamily n=1 Tax=Plasmopara halstedii TaxID=4781 RepID=A0A0P1AW32_PLAHL|nr:Permease of the drug/metabolite transporter (DMT) superfamily [Plasmopara halstedii]CEG45357.1 Permease of the drug/metabolite transporter (DMT) superfamily [Plasmopara halstedii]|eukprot:XP_024581726.1 Permease of the drug/metabolite transporter (DMT) superfamily [Plasmopara halstedii]